jgi:hypothetical protein
MIGMDRSGRAGVEWGVYGVPETFVVKGDGTIAYKFVGPINEQGLRERLMPAIEAAGYKIVLTVHDEILAETPDCADFTVEHLARLMATPPTWAADMPLAAAGFETHRYKKD